MVSIKTLKEYDFSTLEEYFNYIVESKINGQPQQVRELYTKLSKPQRVKFYYYLFSDEAGVEIPMRQEIVLMMAEID